MADLTPRSWAILEVDVYCYTCGQLTAYTNTSEIDGRNYCNRLSTGCAIKAESELAYEEAYKEANQ